MMNEDLDPNQESTPSSTASDQSTKSKLANPGHWLRLLLMLLMYIILFYVVRFIVSIAMIIQWVLVLLSGEPNTRLKSFTKSLNRYSYQIMEFVSFNSDDRPFPLSDWPEADD